MTKPFYTSPPQEHYTDWIYIVKGISAIYYEFVERELHELCIVRVYNYVRVCYSINRKRNNRPRWFDLVKMKKSPYLSKLKGGFFMYDYLPIKCIKVRSERMKIPNWIKSLKLNWFFNRITSILFWNEGQSTLEHGCSLCIRISWLMRINNYNFTTNPVIWIWSMSICILQYPTI